MTRVITRRSFLKSSFSSAAFLCLGCPISDLGAKTIPSPEEARFYEKTSGQTVKCRLCFRNCTIAEGKRGFCRNRENRDGALYSLVYGKAAAVQLDPIEKEPMYHNLPGSNILCTGTASCNFRCKFCHNWHLSQRTVEELAPFDRELTPADIVDIAQKKGAGLSFTYMSPLFFMNSCMTLPKWGPQES